MKFKEENKHLRQYRKQGKSADWLQSWLKGWRQFDNLRGNIK